jgi:hypothetical protein
MMHRHYFDAIARSSPRRIQDFHYASSFQHGMGICNIETMRAPPALLEAIARAAQARIDDFQSAKLFPTWHGHFLQH